MPVYTVSIPLAGAIHIEVEARNTEAAKEIARLRAALERVTNACDPECYCCGAYYVANEALIEELDKEKK